MNSYAFWQCWLQSWLCMVVRKDRGWGKSLLMLWDGMEGKQGQYWFNNCFHSRRLLARRKFWFLFWVGVQFCSSKAVSCVKHIYPVFSREALYLHGILKLGSCFPLTVIGFCMQKHTTAHTGGLQPIQESELPWLGEVLHSCPVQVKQPHPVDFIHRNLWENSMSEGYNESNSVVTEWDPVLLVTGSDEEGLRSCKQPLCLL